MDSKASDLQTRPKNSHEFKTEKTNETYIYIESYGTKYS